MRQVIDDFFSAAERRDWDAAAKVLSSDFKLYLDGVHVYDRPAYVAMLKADDMATLALDLRDVDISVSTDGQMAWARYRAFVESESKGVRSKTRTAETLVLEKSGKVWLIRHTHVSFVNVRDETQ